MNNLNASNMSLPNVSAKEINPLPLQLHSRCWVMDTDWGGCLYWCTAVTSTLMSELVDTKLTHKMQTRQTVRYKSMFVCTLISLDGSKPSSWFSNSNMVLCTSLSPAFSLSNRLVPIASSSSMKIIAGFLSFARAKASLTNLAPSPMNICTSCGPASFKKVDWIW